MKKVFSLVCFTLLTSLAFACDGDKKQHDDAKTHAEEPKKHTQNDTN